MSYYISIEQGRLTGFFAGVCAGVFGCGQDVKRVEHEQAAEVRSRAGLTDAKTPIDRRRVVSEASAPIRNTHTKSGHCRIEETREERTDRGDTDREEKRREKK